FECDENLFEVETYKDIEMVVGSTQKNAATTDGTLSPTLTSAMGQGGGHVPMAVYKEATKKGYSEANEGDSVNYQYPDSETRRGRVGKQVANTLEASGVNQGVVIKNEEIDVVGNIYKSQGQAGKVYTTNGLSPTDRKSVVKGKSGDVGRGYIGNKKRGKQRT